MKLPVLLLTFLFCTSSFAAVKTPDCTGSGAWPASMAYNHLKNEGVIVADKMDHKKTTVTRLVSERLKKDLWRQVHKVIFLEKSGTKITALTLNDVSHQECSMTGVSVFLVSKEVGP